MSHVADADLDLGEVRTLADEPLDALLRTPGLLSLDAERERERGEHRALPRPVLAHEKVDAGPELDLEVVVAHEVGQLHLEDGPVAVGQVHGVGCLALVFLSHRGGRIRARDTK